jgi:hypothetical protein
MAIAATFSVAPSGCSHTQRASWTSWTQTLRLRGMHEQTFRVQRVLDGQVFIVRYRGEFQQVAVDGVRTPSLLEPGGADARVRLVQLIGGKVVKIEFPGGVRYDEMGRPRAKVTVNEQDVATSLNMTILQGGGVVPPKEGGG